MALPSSIWISCSPCVSYSNSNRMIAYCFAGFISSIWIRNHLGCWNTSSGQGFDLNWFPACEMDEYGKFVISITATLLELGCSRLVQWCYFYTIAELRFSNISSLGWKGKSCVWHFKYVEFWCYEEVSGWWRMVPNICKGKGALL